MVTVYVDTYAPLDGYAYATYNLNSNIISVSNANITPWEELGYTEADKASLFSVVKYGDTSVRIKVPMENETFTVSFYANTSQGGTNVSVNVVSDMGIHYSVVDGYRTSTEGGYVGYITCNPTEVRPGESSTVTIETSEDYTSQYEIDYLIIHRGDTTSTITTYRGQLNCTHTITDINTNITVDCYWRLKSTSTVTVSAQINYGTVTGTGQYNPGSNVTLTFTARTGYHLAYANYGTTSSLSNRWDATDTVTTTKTFSITSIQSDWMFVMVAEEDGVYSVEVTIDSGQGIVSGGGNGAPGTTLSISATPDTDYVFERWIRSDGATCQIASETSASTTVTIGTTDDIVSAVFNSTAPHTILRWFKDIAVSDVDGGPAERVVQISPYLPAGISYVIRGRKIYFSGTPTESGIFNVTTAYHLFGIQTFPEIEHRIRIIIDDKDIPDPEIDTDAIQPGGSSVKGTNYLARYDSEDSGGAFLNIPYIKSIEETDSAQLTEVSTIIYGYDRNFIMDTGTTEKLSITFTRVQPDVVVDKVGGEYDTDLDNQHKWSNGHWFTILKKFTDVWQNLTYSSNGLRKGGFTFHFEPLEGCEDLYPIIDRNVFISGSISASFSSNLQNMEVTLPLAVGSMVRTEVQSQGDHEVVYSGGPASEPTYTSRYPSGMSFPAPYPKESWLIGMGIMKFISWTSDNPSAEYDAGEFVVGSSTFIDSITELSASWESPIRIDYLKGGDDNNSRIWYMPDGDVPEDVDNPNVLSERPTSMKIWSFGGGGYGAAYKSSTIEDNPKKTGGSGGSGGFNIQEVTIGPGIDRIRMVAGRRSKWGSSQAAGDSYAELHTYSLISGSISNLESVKVGVAKHGRNGQQGRDGGAGGAGGTPNGASGNPGRTVNEDGHTPAAPGVKIPILENGDYYISENVVVPTNIGKSGDGSFANFAHPSVGVVESPPTNGQPGFIVVAFYR